MYGINGEALNVASDALFVLGTHHCNAGKDIMRIWKIRKRKNTKRR